jgi:hypothetical protein
MECGCRSGCIGDVVRQLECWKCAYVPTVLAPPQQAASQSPQLNRPNSRSEADSSKQTTEVLKSVSGQKGWRLERSRDFFFWLMPTQTAGRAMAWIANRISVDCRPALIDVVIQLSLRCNNVCGVEGTEATQKIQNVAAFCFTHDSERFKRKIFPSSKHFLKIFSRVNSLKRLNAGLGVWTMS